MLMRKVRKGPSWWRTRAIAAAIASPRADSGRTSGGACSLCVPAALPPPPPAV